MENISLKKDESRIDRSNLSLADFYDVEDQDIMGRAKAFREFKNDLFKQKHINYRRVSTSGSAPVMTVIDPYTREEREMIYLASNDYLNLTRHPKVIESGRQALLKYGAGAGSVPLLGGTLDIHTELERKIAKFKGCESAILYTSGFGSNCGTLLSMLGEKDIAILDLYVHASIIDGCKNTNIKFFKHNNMDSLEKVLKRTHDKYRTKFVIVDGVYSMDGDIAPLDKIVEIAHSYGAYVMVDEAHATGVIGVNGRGTPEHCNVEGKVDIVAGTFSKALGGVGGFIATSEELVDLLHYYSRTYMFSTAPTPQVTGSLIAALDVIQEEKDLREKLWWNINYFKKGLLDLGFDIGNAETAIFPIIVGDDFKVKEMCRMCHEAGIYVNTVLYPAVPKRLSRLRLSIMAQHTKEQLDYTLEVLDMISKKLDVDRKAK